MLYRKRESFGFDFKKESFGIDRRYSGMIFSLGTPMAVQSGCINLSMLFVNSMINEVGVVASATFGVGIRIDDIINKISMGVQFAAMPMISQNIGAKKTNTIIEKIKSDSANGKNKYFCLELKTPTPNIPPSEIPNID